MYRKIVAAVNEFTNSESAARYAIALSQSCQAKLFFVFIAQDGMDKDTFRQAESALDRLIAETEGHGIDVESVIERGDPFQRLQDMVHKDHIDIVFTATRREDVSKRFFVRTFARDLMIKLPCSVAMVRVVHMGKMHPKNILVPLRGHMTQLEERAYFTAKLGQAFNAQVTLFHQYSPIKSFFHGEIHLKPAEREEYVPRDIEDFTGYLKRYDIGHERRTGYGTISKAITIEAAHRRNDLIVMGASERSLLKSIMRGNPVEEVLRETPCNLIILRPKNEMQ